MKTRYWELVASLLAGAGSVWAQGPPAGPGTAPPPATYSPPPPGTPSFPQNGPAPSSVPVTTVPIPVPVGPDSWGGSISGPAVCPRPVEAPPCAPVQRLWVDAEYLLWWVKQGPLPVPLVTTGSVTAASPGALGQPGTVVLFGGSDLDYGTFSGGRLTVGGWLDPDATIGLEGRGFLLERRSTGARFASDAAGQPVLGAPFVNALTGQEDIGIVSTPGSQVGGISVSSATRFGGAEGNVLVNLARDAGWTVDFLGGFRYLDLREDLVLRAATGVRPSVTGSSGDPVFLSPVPLQLADAFATHNQFYGGQLGTRLEYRRGNAFVKLAGTVALGYTHQVVDVNGHAALDLRPDGPVLALPFGFFARPSNIGRYVRNEFGVVPEAEVRLGYQLTPMLSAFVGYDFLYWSSVARPGEQINRVINMNLDTPGTPLQPAPLFRTTDFWAQGVNFGLELRY